MISWQSIGYRNFLSLIVECNIVLVAHRKRIRAVFKRRRINEVGEHAECTVRIPIAMI